MSSLRRSPALFLVFGATFGFLLSRGGATTYDYYARLFLFSDLQLLWVIACAVVVGAPGIWLIRRFVPRAVLTGEAIKLTPKPWKRDLIPGALLLGVGWGLAGACPGTVLTMLGEGKVTALFTIAGILVGTWLYGVVDARRQTRAPANAPD